MGKHYNDYGEALQRSKTTYYKKTVDDTILPWHSIVLKLSDRI